MPELPEVEVVRMALDDAVRQRLLLSVHCTQPRLRYPVPDLSHLCGLRLQAVERRAKYLLLHFNQNHTVIWHLGMSGQFHVLTPDAPAAKHEHLRLEFDGGASLRYRDPRRFGCVGLSNSDRWQDHPWLAKLGPEPLTTSFTVERFYHDLQQRRCAIKQVIMDGCVVVGVGNIYASEALFEAGIHPKRAANRVAKHRVLLLHEAIRKVLRAAIQAGGSTIQSFARPDGRPGYFAHEFRVYGRANQPCYDCQRALRQCKQQGRSTFYCVHCQR
jgi:formamidopyrimidine-DNA glycosylase